MCVSVLILHRHLECVRKESGEIEILLDLDSRRTINLKELIPDWWGADRFAE